MAVREFLTGRYAFLSSCAAFMFFFIFASFAPQGIGSCIAHWLNACCVDARLCSPAEKTGQAFEIAVSSMVFLGIFHSFKSFCISVAATFQNVLSRILVHKDSLLEALSESLNLRSLRIVVPRAHPHIESSFATLLWIAICYVSLFAITVLSPPLISKAITGWLQASLNHAGFANLDLGSHPNLRVFLASIIAGMGTIPVAVSSCAFLPLRKAHELAVSTQGILDCSSILGQKSWSDLKSISVQNSGRPNSEVILNFGLLDKIRIRTARCVKEQLLELLNASDEYAVGCKFSPEAMALRSRLQEESKADTFTEASRFSATIFRPRNPGDELKGGHYRIVRKLAGKSMSAVYLARNTENLHVVIKQFVFPTSARNSDELKRNFQREYELLSSLEHEGLARVYEVFEEHSACFIVMEHIRGQDLRSIVVRRGARSENVVRRWALEIAQLMQVMHSHSPPIVHRDLTPDNIMEDETGAIRLVDFGAAHQLVEGITGTLIGKQCYIAPEQLRGKANISSDIYSFGCTLFFLLTGKDPVALKACDLSVENAYLSKELITLILRCTEFDYGKRFNSFSEIIAFLESASSKQPSSFEYGKE